MDFLKKLDIKSIAIIVLGLALLTSIYFRHGAQIDTHGNEIDKLHLDDKALSKKNDSLINANKQLDLVIQDINKQLGDKTIELEAVKQELGVLKKKKDETHKYVNNLSATSVANTFSKYLNTKGSNSR